MIFKALVQPKPFCDSISHSLNKLKALSRRLSPVSRIRCSVSGKDLKPATFFPPSSRGEVNANGSSSFLGDLLVDGLVGVFRLTGKGFGFPTLPLTAVCPESF